MPKQAARPITKRDRIALSISSKMGGMPFPIRVCAACGEQFELKPDKPGFANRCPACSEPEAGNASDKKLNGDDSELNSARRNAMRNLLYRKDS